MSIDYFEKLSIIAQEMDGLCPMARAKIGYNVLADGIVWSDEYPLNLAGRSEDFDCLRILWRYRTSALTEEPDEKWRPYWDHARSLFPNWAGFEPRRLLPSEAIKKLRERRCKHDLRIIELAFDCKTPGE